MTGLWFPANIGFCPNEQAWDAWMAKCKIKGAPYPELHRDRGATFSGFNEVVDDYYPFGLVTVSHAADQPDVDPTSITGLLVHESVHVFQWLCHRMAEHHPSDEFAAYSIQAIYSFMEQQFSEMRWHGKNKATEDHRATARRVGSGNRKGLPRKRRSDQD